MAGSPPLHLSRSHDIGLVARNSLFLTAQPLVMNLVSLLAVAYAARKLGTADFGIFNLVTTYTMLFYPVAQAGMNRVMVRDMASAADKADYAARMVPARVFVTGAAAAGIVLTAFVAGYDSRTTLAILAGTSIFMGQMLQEMVADVFLACERTHFTAVAQFSAGLTLQALSVAVLYAGFGLFAMIAAYAFGQFVGVGLSLYFLHTKFFRLRWHLDLRFAASKLAEGLPFFASVMMWTLFTRIDTVVLSKWGTAAELGLYTAPMLLVARLGIVPQGVSTALLPAVSRLWAGGETRQVADLVRSVSDTLLILALPSVVLVGAYADPITTLLFGADYAGSGLILAIGIWIVLFRCVGAVQFSVLAGSNREKHVMRVYAGVTVYCVGATWLLVRGFGMIGAVLGSLSTQVLLTVLLAWYSPVRRLFHAGVALRTAGLSAVMCVTAYATRGWNPWVSMGFVASLAVAGAFALSLVRPDQLVWLGRTFRRA